MIGSIYVVAVLSAVTAGLPIAWPATAASLAQTQVQAGAWHGRVTLVQTPAPPPAAADPIAGAGTLPRASVQKFVSDFYLAGEDLSAEQIEAIYAPRVVYYGTPTSRASIIRDQQAYTRRWPQRRYTLIDDTLAITAKPNAPKTFDVSFDYDFEVRAADRTSMGRGFTRLTLDFSVPGGQIVAVEGRVTQRRR
jgi:hypothetical protein